jgi:hypothetical protein
LDSCEFLVWDDELYEVNVANGGGQRPATMQLGVEFGKAFGQEFGKAYGEEFSKAYGEEFGKPNLTLVYYISLFQMVVLQLDYVNEKFGLSLYVVKFGFSFNFGLFICCQIMTLVCFIRSSHKSHKIVLQIGT